MVFSLGVLALIAIAASCREPTQITLRITSGEKCSDLTGVQIVVGPSADVTQTRFTQHYAAALTHDCTANGTDNLIGTLVITPGQSTGTVVVSAGVSSVVGGTLVPGPDPASCADLANAKSCIIARRSFSFIDHSSLNLPIDLDPLCVGKVCDPSSTCFKGSCVNDVVGCNDSSCLLPEETGTGSGTDGSSSDGAYDQDGSEPGDAMITMQDGSSGMDSGGISMDASSDANDGGVVSMTPDGGTPPCVTLPSLSCVPPSGHGRQVLGANCSGAAGANLGCCYCTCPNLVSVVYCDLPMGASSCAPMQACL